MQKSKSLQKHWFLTVVVLYIRKDRIFVKAIFVKIIFVKFFNILNIFYTLVPSVFFVALVSKTCCYSYNWDTNQNIGSFKPIYLKNNLEVWF